MRPLKVQLQELKQNSIIALASEGEWSLHDLLPHLLLFTGPAHVSVTSFSLSEEAVRVFNFEKDKGNILSLNCLFDYTMRNHKVDLMLFLQNIATEIRTAPNHAKLFIIENNNYRVAVMGSANLTPNPRFELASVFTKDEDFTIFKDLFLEIWQKAIPYS